MRQSLAVAFFGGVKAGDMEAMATKLKEMALAGDLKAMRMFMELAGLGSKAPSPPQEDSKAATAIAKLAESVSDMVDEVRIARGLAEKRATDPLLMPQRNGKDTDDDE